MKRFFSDRCECSDPGCPVHLGNSKCMSRPGNTVRRIDTDDGNTTFEFCAACTDDAMDSGVFAID